MKANQIQNYPLFIFTAKDYCMQTADHDILKFIFDYENKSEKVNFSIGDKMSFRMNEGGVRKFEINNISIKNVVEDTELNQFGVISCGCTQTSGKQKEEPMFLHIEMDEIE